MAIARPWLVKRFVASVLAAAYFAAPANAQEGLDLSSTSAHIVVDQQMLGGNDALTIRAANTPRTIQVGDRLTTAELAALRQIANSGSQHLLLGTTRTAVGGTVHIEPTVSQLGSVNVPSNVTAIARGAALDVIGSFIANGTFTGLGGGTNLFSLTAGSIKIGAGGAITSPVDLNLLSRSSIQNAGSIVANNVNLFATNGTITNSGLIQASLGNVALNTLAANHLVVENTGAISALNGVITARDTTFTGKAMTVLNGGTWSAQALNVFGGNGLAKILATAITAPINISAGDAHIYTATGDLTIASMHLTGDPTIVNNGGDITLLGNAGGGSTLRFSGEHLAVIAAGRIIADAALTLIDLSSTTAKGGNLTLLSGFHVKPAPGAGTTTTTTIKYTLGLPSNMPAHIDITGVNIDTSSTAGNGGKVTIAARDMTLGDSVGSVVVSGINTSSATGTGGAVLLIGNNDPIVTFGEINTSGKIAGEVTVASGIAAPAGIVSFNNGLMTGVIEATESLTTGAPILIGGNVNAAGATAADISLYTPGAILLGNGISLRGKDVLAASNGMVLLGNNLLEATDTIGLFMAGVGGDILMDVGVTMRAESDIFLLATEGSILDSGGSTFDAIKGSVLYAVKNDILLAGASTYKSGDSLIFLADQGAMAVASGNSFVANGTLAMLVNGGIDIASGNTLKAGVLAAGAPITGVLSPEHVNTEGDLILLSYAPINLASALESNGGDMMVAAIGAGNNVTLGSGLDFRANGGYVTMFAGGQLMGDSNTFVSRAYGTPTNFKGGLIQMSSGFTFSPDVISLGSTVAGNEGEVRDARAQILSTARNLQSFARGNPTGFNSPALDPGGIVLDPTILGNNVFINGNGLEPGLVLPNAINGGAIDIGGSGISISRGAAIFDSVGPSAHIELPNSSFTVESYDLLPTGLFDNIVSEVTAFLDGVDINLPGLDLGLLKNSDGGVTILPTDENRRGIFNMLTKSNGNDAEDGDKDPPIKNGSLFGRVSMLAAKAIEKRYSNQAVVDTGKTEPRGSLGSIVAAAAAMRVINRSEVTQGMLGNINLNMLSYKASHTTQPMVRISEQRPDVMLFTTSNQIMSGNLAGGPDSIMVASEGTTVSPTEDGVILHTGGLVADTGDKPSTVISKTGSIKISSNTTAAVVSSPDDGVRIIALAGNDRSAVTFTPHGAQQAQQFDMKPGDELIIPNPKHDTPADRANPNASRSIDVIAKGTVSPAKFVNSELAGSLPRPSIRLSGARSNYMRMLSRLQGTIQQDANAASTNLFTNVKLGGDAAPTRLVASDGTLIQQEGNGLFSLKNGSILTSSPTAVTVKTDLAEIKTRSKAVLSVDAAPGQVRVRACSGPGHVQMKVGKHTITLNPGEEILIADERPTKGEALGNDGIGRRQLSVEQIGEDLWAVTGDFSIASMLNGAGYVKPLRQNESASSKKLIGDLMKTHAALEYSTPGHGRYYAQPKETALTPDWVFRCQAGE